MFLKRPASPGSFAAAVARSLVRVALPTLTALVAVSAFVLATGAGDDIADAGDAASAVSAPGGAAEALAAPSTPPPSAGPFHFEMDWPADGMTFDPQTGDTIRGHVSGPGIPVTVEAYDPATATWVFMGTAVSAAASTPLGTTGSVPAHAWSLPASVPGFWAPLKYKGGVLRLRATPYPNWSLFNAMGIPRTFDVDGAACLAAAYPSMTWTQAAQQCGSLFPLTVAMLSSGGVGTTVLSTAKVPADNYAVPVGLLPPGYIKANYISLVAPVSSAVLNNTAQPPLVGQHYYQTIQPPATLTAFRGKYGFNASGSGPYTNGEVESTYYNKGDLGIGRNMHCRRYVRLLSWFNKEKGLACYVMNYAKTFNGEVSGVFFGEDEDFVLQQTILKAPVNHFATVAMVQIEGSNRTDFIVYDDIGNLQPFARLDGTGHNAAVPTNCLSCHGGAYSGSTTAGGIATDARFLPFDSDPRILKFSATQPGYTLAAQATNIRNLNMMIHQFPQTTTAVKKQIALMYSGNENAAPGPAYVPGFVPTTWQDDAQSIKLYREVVHPYCIGCHLSFPNPAVTGYDPFASYSAFVADAPTVINDVCVAHRMPNAQQTANAFWKSPARAYLLNAFGALTDICDP